MLEVLVEMLRTLDERIRLLDTEIARRAKEDEVARRLMTIPGVDPVIARALTALAPAAETFKRGRDFAAWLGLHRCNIPRVATSGRARLRRWGNEPCAACSSSERVPLYGGQHEREP